MGKRITIKQVSEITGLFTFELRLGVKSGKYPYMFVGEKQKKILFDIELLTEQLLKINLENIKDKGENKNDKLRKIEN